MQTNRSRVEGLARCIGGSLPSGAVARLKSWAAVNLAVCMLPPPCGQEYPDLDALGIRREIEVLKGLDETRNPSVIQDAAHHDRSGLEHAKLADRSGRPCASHARPLSGWP